jgi:hypothetical protein
MPEGRRGGRCIEGNTKLVLKFRQKMGVSRKTERNTLPAYNTISMARMIVIGLKQALIAANMKGVGLIF